MSTDKESILQKERLTRVTWKQWLEAIDELVVEISRLLHGSLEDGPYGTKVIVGGYTKYGAHSSYELGGDPLYHYVSIVVEKLYDGSFQWKPEKSLPEQLKLIANSVIPKQVTKYNNKKKREEEMHINTKPVSLDVVLLGCLDDRLNEATEYMLRDDTDLEMGNAQEQQALSRLGGSGITDRTDTEVNPNCWTVKQSLRIREPACTGQVTYH